MRGTLLRCPVFEGRLPVFSLVSAAVFSMSRPLGQGRPCGGTQRCRATVSSGRWSSLVRRHALSNEGLPRLARAGCHTRQQLATARAAIATLTCSPDRRTRLRLPHPQKQDLPNTVIATGIAEDGGREVLGLMVRDSETEVFSRRRWPAWCRAAQLAGLRSPIGRDVGARTREETALPIVAELVADRHGSFGPAPDKRAGPFTMPPRLSPGRHMTDPVGRMVKRTNLLGFTPLVRLPMSRGPIRAMVAAVPLHS